MNLFQRTIRILLFLTGLAAGLITAVAYFFSRRIIAPPRSPLWKTPADVGLEYEEAQFPAKDGVRIAGWFIPAADQNRNDATLIMAHGWPWNRLGTTADDMLSNLNGESPLDLLRLAHGLHQEGFNLLMIDLRNHGESASAPPVSFGIQESYDLLGAIEYLNGRDDINPNRIGAIGFSMGANSVLYALPQTDAIQAAVAVQPTSVSVFTRRYGQNVMGRFSAAVLPLVELLYRREGGLPFNAIQPAFAAAGAGDTPVLYIQGNGDNWGSVHDVEQMAAATPNGRGPLYMDTSHRFGGYLYAIDNPKVLSAFFEQHLPE